MFALLRYAGLGVLGYITPRILVAAGMPLNEWAISVGSLLGASAPLVQAWGAEVMGLVVAAVLITTEAWWHPLQRLLARCAISPENSKTDPEVGQKSASTDFVDDLPTWAELENRFSGLESELQFARIDGQTGDAGEHWRLVPGMVGRGDAERRFKSVARLASARLFRDLPDEVNKHPELAAEIDPVIRWYKALQYIGGRYEMREPARQHHDDGTYGLIFYGSIAAPATASVTLCLELASRRASQGS